MPKANKYHYNPETGQVGECTASKRDCKYHFSEEQHFNSAEEARTAYEKTQKSFAVPNNKTTLKNKVQKALPKGRLDDKITYEDYYAGTDRKHFGKKRMTVDEEEEYYSRPGSQFDHTKVSSLQELTKLTIQSHGGTLDNVDDKQKLIELGADERSFMDDCRYLVTPVGGRLGFISSRGLSDSEKLDFYEKVPGSNIVSITIERTEKPNVDFGVLIVAKRSWMSPDNLGDNPDETVEKSFLKM